MIASSTRNALANCHNVYQGQNKRVLCVCSAGLLRSPTAAFVLQKEFGFNTRAAGTYDYALIPVSEVLLDWADEIVCMENVHAHMITTDPMYEKYTKPIVTLQVPDRFDRMDVELQAIILALYRQAYVKTYNVALPE